MLVGGRAPDTGGQYLDHRDPPTSDRVRRGDVSLLTNHTTTGREMDLSQPDGTGSVSITNITIDQSGTTYNFEGPVEGYGTVYSTQYWEAVDEGRTRGTMEGEARVLGNDGTLISSPLRGTFRRDGTRAELFFTDCVSNGDMNFVRWEVDFLTKQVSVSYYSLND
jgi:hypothetical protein